MPDKNLYDFEHVDDLPEELRGAVQRTKLPVDEYAEIVTAAPHPLSMSQIRAVAHRKGLELPSENTVRKYLDQAIERGLICRISRQKYAKPGTPVEDPKFAR